MLKPAPAYVGVRIAKLLSAELVNAVERKDFGVIIQDIAPVAFDSLIEALADPSLTRAQRLHTSLVGETSVVASAIAKHPHLADLLASTEEEAVAWRNQNLRTIAVVTTRPLTKAASLRDFRVISERDVAGRLCSEERDKAEVSWLRTLWDVIARGRALRIPLADIIEFAVALSALPATERSTRASQHLHLLKLFPDQFLADEKSDQRLLRRLQQNRELVGAIKRASAEDWNRVRAYLKTLKGAEKTAASRLAKKLREESGMAAFRDVEFADALALWKSKAHNAEPGKRSKSGVERVELERAVGRMLMGGDETRLADVAEEVGQAVQAAWDDDSHAGDQDIRSGSDADSVSTVEVDRRLLTAVKARSTSEEWGGIIEVTADRAGVLTEASVVKSWRPFTLAPIVDDLKKFVEEGLGKPCTGSV